GNCRLRLPEPGASVQCVRVFRGSWFGTPGVRRLLHSTEFRDASGAELRRTGAGRLLPVDGFGALRFRWIPHRRDPSATAASHPMSTDKRHAYRGDVRAVGVCGGALAFVTVHPEGQPTPLYRLNPEKLTLTESAMPTGGQVLLAVGDDLWIG